MNYAELVAAAAVKCGVTEEELEAHAVKVTVILPGGKKVTYHYADLVGSVTAPEAKRRRSNTRKA
jgi:hypothetical protein